jgi:protein TonB
MDFVSYSSSSSRLNLSAALSIIFHVLLLLVFSDIAILAVENTKHLESQSPIQLTLSQSANGFLPPKTDHRTLPLAPQIPPRSKIESSKTRLSSDQAKKNDSEKAEPEQLGFSKTPHETSEVVNNEIAILGTANSPDNQSELPNADDVQRYRLSLGREVKRNRQYPLLARERGNEGVVSLIVNRPAGIAMPLVSIHKSSGTQLLDTHALQMVERAVRDARVPESLRNRDFAIDLSIQFSLADD